MIITNAYFLWKEVQLFILKLYKILKNITIPENIYYRFLEDQYFWEGVKVEPPFFNYTNLMTFYSKSLYYEKFAIEVLLPFIGDFLITTSCLDL